MECCHVFIRFGGMNAVQQIHFDILQSCCTSCPETVTVPEHEMCLGFAFLSLTDNNDPKKVVVI